MTRMLVLGDTHGDVQFLERACRAARKAECDHIVQVGDWGFLWPGRKERNDRLSAITNVLAQFDLHMFFLDGNHEWYGRLEEMGATVDAPDMVALSDRVTYLPRGFTWEWDGVKFMSLGGAYSIDQDQRTKFIDHWPQETIRYADADRAIAAGHVDVMFTHDVPEGVHKLEAMLHRTSEQYRARYGAKWNYKLDPGSRANRRTLRAVTDEVRPLLLIHGHYHWRYDDTLVGSDYTTEVRGLDCNGTGAQAWGVVDTSEVLLMRLAVD